MFDTVNINKRAEDLSVSGELAGYSGVKIVVDDETTYIAGNDLGRVLTVQNPWGTQEQADNILSKIMGVPYQGFSATKALLDPAAELGDAVSVNGLFGGIYSIKRNLSPLMSADVSAPYDEEIDHEYPYKPAADREITRRFLAVQSEFTLQSNEIAAKVSQTGGDNTSFGWSLVSDHFSLFSGSTEVFRVDASGATVKGVITATSGQIGNFNIGNQAIWNNIPDFANAGGLTSGVYLGTDGMRLGRNFTVDTAGNINAANATLTGTLIVGTKKIDANDMRVGAQESYDHHGSWTGTTTAWNNATTQGTTKGPNYFTADYLYAIKSLGAPNIDATTKMTCSKIKIGSKNGSWQPITIDGASYNILIGT